MMCIQYNLEELIFLNRRTKKIRFIDSEEYLHKRKKQVNQYYVKVLKVHY
jgi:hypothetical protein